MGNQLLRPARVQVGRAADGPQDAADKGAVGRSSDMRADAVPRTGFEFVIEGAVRVFRATANSNTNS
jgi:hypothetical protein